jgi:uncharacterized repeat protein (TIGR03847 family)
VAELALGYSEEEDLVILVTREVQAEEEDPEEARVIRFWCTRSQMRSLAHWGLEIVSRGRPICPQCGAPMESEDGHFCPKKNGHRTD